MKNVFSNFSWALRYGPIVLGAINSISGIMINRHYRWRFKLGSYGHFSSGIPIAVMPGLLTIVFHKHVSFPIIYDILIII